MISFKLVSGFYHNLTYSSGEVVNLDFSKITESDIRWFEDSDNIKYILGETVDVIYNGKSRIDGSPMFLIDIDKESRDIMIRNLLK